MGALQLQAGRASPRARGQEQSTVFSAHVAATPPGQLEGVQQCLNVGVDVEPLTTAAPSHQPARWHLSTVRPRASPECLVVLQRA